MYDVGSCPICGDGLRGVRICCGRPVIVCDECDAVWSSPDLEDRLPSRADPVCGKCGAELWGERARWATREEIEAVGWWPQVRQSAAADLTFPTTEDGPAHAPSAPGAVYRAAVFVLLLVGAAIAALAVL